MSKFKQIDPEEEEIYSDEGIVCPYCGYIYEEPEAIYDQEIEKLECPSCEKNMDVRVEISWNWTTSKRTKEIILGNIRNEEKNNERNGKFYKNDNDNPYLYKIKKLKEELNNLKEIE